MLVAGQWHGDGSIRTAASGWKHWDSIVVKAKLGLMQWEGSIGMVASSGQCWDSIVGTAATGLQHQDHVAMPSNFSSWFVLYE